MKMHRIGPGIYQAVDETEAPTYTLYVSQNPDITDADPEVQELEVTVTIP